MFNRQTKVNQSAFRTDPRRRTQIRLVLGSSLGENAPSANPSFASNVTNDIIQSISHFLFALAKRMTPMTHAFGHTLVLGTPWCWAHLGVGHTLVLGTPWCWPHLGVGHTLMSGTPWCWAHLGVGHSLVLATHLCWAHLGVAAPWCWAHLGVGHTMVLGTTWCWHTLMTIYRFWTTY